MSGPYILSVLQEKQRTYNKDSAAISAQMLIAARALQGLAEVTLAPSTLSLIRNMFLID
jgi:hypothetical protein